MAKSMETYLAAAYWAPRKESVEECASRAVKFLTALSQMSDYFHGWRSLSRSRSEAIRAIPIDLSTRALTELFLKGRNRRDIGDDVIDELGFRISVWNGKGDSEVSSLTMKCGLYSTFAGLYNAIVLKIPPQFDLSSIEKNTQLIIALWQAWDPDWAIVASQSKVNQQDDLGQFLDKALYVRSSVDMPHNLLDTDRSEKLGEGLLFLSQ